MKRIIHHQRKRQGKDLPSLKKNETINNRIDTKIIGKNNKYSGKIFLNSIYVRMI
ncbi:MAG: hypothetical protein ACP5IB_07540 [Thermoplasmata archaeon]